MKKLFLFLLFGISIGALGACSTIVKGSNQPIPFKSNVPGVSIKLLDKNGATVFEGKTPTTITLKTSNGGYFDPAQYTVIASKDGYKTQETVVNWHVSGWYIVGNFVFGGAIGWLVVDPLTGAMYYLDEEVNLDMIKK